MGNDLRADDRADPRHAQANPGDAGGRAGDARPGLAAQLRARADAGADLAAARSLRAAFRLPATQPQLGRARALYVGAGKLMRRRFSVPSLSRSGSARGRRRGCFSPQPDRSKFFVLAPSADAANSVAPAGLGASSAATIIGLGPIKLPDYLDRDEVVTRVGPNRLELSDQDRWAEPLDNNFKQVIAQDLTQSLGTHSITFFPWPGTTRVDYQVRIDVYRFETDPATRPISSRIGSCSTGPASSFTRVIPTSASRLRREKRSRPR